MICSISSQPYELSYRNPLQPKLQNLGRENGRFLPLL